MESQRQRSLRAKNLDRREEGGSTDTCWTTIVVVQGTEGGGLGQGTDSQVGGEKGPGSTDTLALESMELGH